LLPRLTVATACTADWNAMSGDDRVRFCGSCGRNVYNVAALTRRQVYRLVEAHEGKPPCIRIFRRPDGTIVTRDCVTRVGAAARSVWLHACAYAAMAAAFWTSVLLGREIIHPRGLATSQPAASSPSTSTPAPRVKPYAGGEQIMGQMDFHERDALRPEPARPSRVSIAELTEALRPVREEAQACATRYGAHGVIHYEIAVARDGKVRARSSSGALRIAVARDGKVRARSSSGALRGSDCDRALRAAIARMRFRSGRSRVVFAFSLAVRP
jgi:hypothetical protein